MLPLSRCCRSSRNTDVALLPQRCRHSSIVAIAQLYCRTSPPQQLRCHHRVIDTAAAMLHSPHCRSSRVVATTAATLPPRCRYSSSVTATAAALVPLCRCLQQRDTATARCRRPVPQQPRRVVATAAVMLPSHCRRSVAATAASLPLRCRIVAHCRRSSHVAIAATPLPAQQLGCYGCLLPQQLRCRHISPIATTASAALPQPQPPLPMPLPPTPLRCAPMQPRLRCRCHLCHL
jgi:hypothetical protein